jgi:hypothetical protein
MFCFVKEQVIMSYYYGIGIAFFLIAVFIFYRIGKNDGSKNTIMEIARGIRKNLHEMVVKPWINDFMSRYGSNQNSYDINESSLSACATLAMNLYRLRYIFPEIQNFHKLRYNLPHSFAQYITITQQVFYDSIIDIDPHWGSPTGYIDAFLTILELNKGHMPEFIWFDLKTFNLSEDPLPNQNNIKIKINVDYDAPLFRKESVQ